MNLPELYNRVTAKRPEVGASVVYSHIIDVRDGGPPIWGWFWEVSDGMGVHVHHSIAAALILARWVEALPDWSHLMVRGRFPSNRGWTIYPSSQELDYYSTPIEALAAFYLGENT